MYGKSETLSEENGALIERAQAGDDRAMEELIEKNMGLVKSIAKRFTGRNAEFEDLVQIGAIGMLKAAKSFDASFGTVFSTYAVPLIIGEIRRFLRDDGLIKVSRDLRRRGSEIMRQKERFVTENAREPKISELAVLCGMSEEEVVYALDAVCPVYSLQESLGGDDDGATLESVTPSRDDELEKKIDKIALREAVFRLDEQSRKIILLRYYKELSQQQTAQILGLTQVKVSREEKRIFALLYKELS